MAELRDALRKNVVRPLDLVMLTRERIESVLDDAVKQGRMASGDAQKVVGSLVDRGRKQTNDVLGDLEQLLGRGRDEIDDATGDARKRGGDTVKDVVRGGKKAVTRAREAADPALAQADRLRRRAGVGPNFPVLAYDDLSVGQVRTRLDGLTPAELRKVRDYERRNANRKSVLSAIESKLD